MLNSAGQPASRQRAGNRGQAQSWTAGGYEVRRRKCHQPANKVLNPSIRAP
jgi:hypothetical protein